MKKLFRSILSTAAAAVVALSCMASPVSAAGTAEINVIGWKAVVQKTSEVYIGTFMLDDEVVFKYIYSGDVTNSPKVQTAVKEALEVLKETDPEFLLMMDDAPASGTGLKLCTDNKYISKMNQNCKDIRNLGLMFKGYYQRYMLMELLEMTKVGASKSIDNILLKALDAENYRDVEIVDSKGKTLYPFGVVAITSRKNEDTARTTVKNGQTVNFVDRVIVGKGENVVIRYSELNLCTIKGDLNYDGKVNMRDYAELQKYLLGQTKTIRMKAADLNYDKKINMRDYSRFKTQLLRGVSE